MKNFFLPLSLCLVSFITFSQDTQTQIAIIPEPVKITKGSGVFTLPGNVIIEVPAQQELNQAISFLRQRLSVATGYPVTINSKSSSASIKLELNATTDAVIGTEGYYLSVTPKNILIK